MNISDINTVSDLINANKQQEQTDYNKGKELLKQIYKMDPAIGKAMCVHILENLLGMHLNMVERNQEAGDMRYALLWQTDATRLDDAISNIKMVQLLDDDGNEVAYDDIHN
jgi:hypothetical protein